MNIWTLLMPPLILRHVEPLLGIDREISNYATAIAK
jgi:hypothetical protein